MDGAGGSDEQMQDMYDRESGQCSQCWVTITCLRLFLPRCSTSRCKITNLITRRFFPPASLPPACFLRSCRHDGHGHVGGQLRWSWRRCVSIGMPSVRGALVVFSRSPTSSLAPPSLAPPFSFRRDGFSVDRLADANFFNNFGDDFDDEDLA